MTVMLVGICSCVGMLCFGFGAVLSVRVHCWVHHLGISQCHHLPRSDAEGV